MPDQPLPDLQQTALRAQIKDAQVALAWFEGPAYARIQEQYEGILAEYDRLLHSIELDATARDRMCFAVAVAKRFLGVKARFAQQLASAQARLDQLEHEARPQPPVWDRILSFVR